MAHDLSVLCLAADYAEVVASPEAERWALKLVAPLEVLATMSPRSTPNDKFQARLLWTEYPGNPPSLKFRNLGTGDIADPRAWPVCPGFRPTSCDACVNWTAEGLALHPEWAHSAATRWNPSGNALYRVLCILQDTLDLDFNGRFQG